VYYELYVLLDIYSRYVVGWTVAACEDAQIAKQLISTAAAVHGAPGTRCNGAALDTAKHLTGLTAQLAYNYLTSGTPALSGIIAVSPAGTITGWTTTQTYRGFGQPSTRSATLLSLPRCRTRSRCPRSQRTRTSSRASSNDKSWWAAGLEYMHHRGRHHGDRN